MNTTLFCHEERHPKNLFLEHFYANYSHYLHILVKKWGSGNPVSKIWQPCLSMAFKNGTNNFIVLKNLNGTDFSNWYSFLEDFSEKNCNLATLPGWFWQPCLLDTFENVTIRFLVPKTFKCCKFWHLTPIFWGVMIFETKDVEKKKNSVYPWLLKALGY